MKCAICGNEIAGFGNNGRPLVNGKVCDSCNWKVIQERLNRSRLKDLDKEDSSATEAISLGEVDGVVVGGGPINVTTPMEDFEKYAKQFEETFILGKTPVRKEKVENNLKIDNGEVCGDVISLENSEVELPQVEPIKSATEALQGLSEIYEFLKICKEVGITDFGWLQKFVEEHPGDPLEELRKYKREYLGHSWSNKDLSEEDKSAIDRLDQKQWDYR